MGRRCLHSIRSILAVIAGAMVLTVAAQAAAPPWRKAWRDYDSHQQSHDANWWMQNRHDCVIGHHPERTEDYSGTRGQTGDSDQLHLWYHRDGGFDRSNAAAIIAARNEPRKSRGPSVTKRGSSVKTARES